MYISRMPAVQQREREQASPATVENLPPTKSRPAVPSQQFSQRMTPLQLLVLALGVQGLATRVGAQPFGFVPNRPGPGLPGVNALRLMGAAGAGALVSANMAHAATANPSQTPNALKAAQRRERKREEEEVVQVIESQIYRLGPFKPDKRPQSRLPTKDPKTGRNDLGITTPMLESIARWAKETRPHETENRGMAEQFEIPFKLAQQRRMVNALVSASPILTRWLNEAKDGQIKIGWGEQSLFKAGSKKISIANFLNLDRKSLDDPNFLIFQFTSSFVAELAHELAHSRDPNTYKRSPNPYDFTSKNEFKNNFFSHFAKAESTAIYEALTVAEEIFHNTGVDLGISNGSYREGEAQNIFHSKKMTIEQKMKALEAYQIKAHTGFYPGGLYDAAANSIWENWQTLEKSNAGEGTGKQWKHEDL